MLKFMKEALALAKKAGECGDVPVGAVVVKDGEIIGRGENKKEQEKDPTAHAEIVAIKDAAEKLNSWHLDDCTLYVTLEPCPMCMGAIIGSRISKVVFGAFDLKSGVCGSVMDMSKYPFCHRPEIIGGIMEDECKALLSDFFQQFR